MFNVSSMFNDVAPKLPPMMAPCLKSPNGTAKTTYCAFNQQRYGYHTSIKDAQCLANTMTNCGIATQVTVAIHINSETSKTSSMLTAHGVRGLYPAEMLQLHDDHSYPEPTYMELHPTTIGIRRTIGVP